MTLTDSGIDFICQRFGDITECCVADGLIYGYTDLYGNAYTGQVGGTATIVAALAMGILQSLTMENPSRIAVTQAQLNAANNGTVTLLDAQEITYHDETTEDQWCYAVTQYVTCYRCVPVGNGYTIPESQVFEGTTCPSGWFDTQPPCNPPPEYVTCYRCVSIGNGYTVLESQVFAGAVCPEGWSSIQPTCNPPPCSFWDNQADCEAEGCYWYDESCHSEPPGPPVPETPWLILGGIAVAVIAGIIIYKVRG
jgi:hypothetical protein